ncbi:MAG: hypothetical protein ACE5IZ_04855 [Dehalococcoidia bacterium]
MAEVFAGFVAGYLMAIVFTGLGAVMLARARTRVSFLARSLAPNLSWVMLAVPISVFAFLIWTAVGMILGLLYRGAESNIPGAGLGSPNLVFTLAIVLFALANLAVVEVPLRRLHWPLVGMGLAFAAAFGWMLPHLAEAGR